MTEIVGGLSVKELMDKGTEFEVILKDYEDVDSKEDSSYLEEVSLFTKMGCLEFGDTYSGKEPFDNIAKKMSDLLPNGKIKKRVLREGYGSKLEPPINVKIHYNAYTQHEALPFDSTYARKEPCSFDIGDGQVIEGLDLAVQSMKINEKSQFLIDSELAYRSSGMNRVPPNSRVLFEIEMVGVMQPAVNKGPQVNEKEFSYVYPFSLGQCVKGKRMFRLKDYQGAIREYNIAVEKLEEALLSNYDEQLKSNELLVRLYTNLLICHTHIQNPKKACLFAQRIYEMSKDKTFKVDSKVYFNHAKCLRMLGDFERAEIKLNQAKKLEPRNPEILQEYLAIRKAAQEYKRKMVSMGRALVNT